MRRTRKYTFLSRNSRRYGGVSSRHTVSTDTRAIRSLRERNNKKGKTKRKKKEKKRKRGEERERAAPARSASSVVPSEPSFTYRRIKPARLRHFLRRCRGNGRTRIRKSGRPLRPLASLWKIFPVVAGARAILSIVA